MPKRTYRELRRGIRKLLKCGDATTYGVAEAMECHWLTALRHLEYLKYRGIVVLKVDLPQVKMWGLRKKR